MKKSREENGLSTPRGDQHHLRRYKFLKVEPAVVKITHLRYLFTAITTLGIGVLVGFNVKDLMIRNCCFAPIRKQNLRAHVIQNEVKVEKKQPLPPLDQTQTKKSQEPFSKLPQKFLASVPMRPPASYFSIRYFEYVPIPTSIIEQWGHVKGSARHVVSKKLRTIFILACNRPWKIMDKIGKDPQSRNVMYFFMILIKTAAGFARRRFLIRQTWGSLASIEGKKIGVAFVVGVPLDTAQQTLLEKENQLYGDIIQGDVSDTYRTLPSKVLSGYQFVTEYMGNVSEYFVSTDDDCFINIPNTYAYFSQMEPSKRNAAHCGYIYSAKSSRVSNMRSKWGVADEIYPLNAYPKFCHGGMTVYSYEILRDIYNVSLITNYTGFHLEDVLTNGILREKLQREDSIRPIYMRDPKTKKRLPLMWHLGLRKDKEEAFVGIWAAIRRRLSYYDGPFDFEKGFRAVMNPIVKLEGKSFAETVDYFSPAVMPEKKISKLALSD